MKGEAPVPATIYIHSGFSLKNKIGQLVKLGHLGQGSNVMQRTKPQEQFTQCFYGLLW